MNVSFSSSQKLGMACCVIILCSTSFLIAQAQTITVIQGESIAEEADEVMIQAYPNPVETELTLETPANFELQEVLIYDAEGVLVESISLDGNSLPASFGVCLESGTYHMLGIGAFFGKVNWGLALTVGIGVILIAGSGTGGC